MKWCKNQQVIGMMSRHSGQREERELGVESGSLFSPVFTRMAFNLLARFLYTSSSYFEKVVVKGARDNPERHCGWF